MNKERLYQEDEDDEKKKKNRLPFIITVIIILLLFFCALVLILVAEKPEVDPDITIVTLINNNVKTEADNSLEGYEKAKHIGYVLDDLLLSKENRVIVWDSVNDCYLLYEDSALIFSPTETPASGTDLWIYLKEVPETSPFSVHSTATFTAEREVADEDGHTHSQTFTFKTHEYATAATGNSVTYTCTEEHCGYSYTVGVQP